MPKPRKARARSAGGGPARTTEDWQERAIATLRQVIREADPVAVEEQKWRKPSNPEGVPVWSHDGIICHVGALKHRVRLTFLKGARLEDPSGLFNACLDGHAMRAIDFGETDPIDRDRVQALVRAAVALNARTVRARP